jgi:uncharacterized repeat protein (TIGR03843 family)
MRAPVGTERVSGDPARPGGRPDPPPEVSGDPDAAADGLVFLDDAGVELSLDEWLDLDEDDEDHGDDPDHDGADAGAVPFVYDATVAPGAPGMRELLERGTLEVLGMMPWSSNGTFLVDVRSGTDHAPAVYKPEGGERPLWDFPRGLWRREAAASELSDVLGLDLVPPTVVRDDGPFGVGSVQAFVPARYEEHYFTVREDDTYAPGLRRLAAFDIVANSADRKGGHCLIDDDGRLWAIDNGLTFHQEFKVRTVVWDFAGDPLPGELADALRRLLDGGLPPTLAALLDTFERDAVLTRAGALLASGRLPHDPTGRRYPWPLV